MLLVFTFGCVLGFANTLGSTAGVLCEALGYSDSTSSLFGAVFITGSIIGAAIFGTIVEIYKIYKTATTLICLIGTISIVLVAGMFVVGSVPLLCITFLLTGSALALMAVGIDFAVELTYPVAEPISTGLLMSIGNLIGMVLTISIGFIVKYYGEKGAYISLGMLTVTSLISLLLSLFIKQDLRRLRKEKADQKNGPVITTTGGNLSCEETAREQYSRVRYTLPEERSTDPS